MCETPISENEFSEVVNKLKINKSPGLDGLTPEFYKHFWSNLSTPFCNMVNESFVKNTLPETMKIAVVSLLHKKNLRFFLKNFRAINLTNYDYKIITFALSYRLQKVITNLVSKNQSAYIKTRYIGDNF